MSVLTEMTDDELCSAGGRLQRAHDYIEVQGFNIDTYGHRGEACCYIGSVKVCTGGESDPIFSHDRAGNGVIAALRILDDLAPGVHKKRAERESTHLGRAVEVSALYNERFKNSGPQEQAEKALPIFRKAIREVQAEMERRA